MKKRAGNRDQHQQARHHPSKDEKQFAPVLKTQHDRFARGEAKALTQALNQVSRWRDRFQSPGEVLFKVDKIILQIHRHSVRACLIASLI
ncbi:MAG: hypothetical protein IPM31_10665 [Anaerolineae bacterium]|nr:hypothetical protein [Anaerolineae bacterium]